MIHGRSTTISARLDLFGGLNQQEEEQQWKIAQSLF